VKYYQGLGPRLTSASSVFMLGMFDGLHLGHQYLLRQGRNLAQNLGIPLVVMSFSSDEELCLTSLHHKRRLFERFGVNILVDVPFTKVLKDTTADAFVDILQQMIPIHTWVGGVDLRFGKDREGSCDFLVRRKGIKTLFVDRLLLDGEDISSTKIRRCIASGELAKAAFFLGRPYSLVAPATPVDRHTYALDICRPCLPPSGNYSAEVCTEGRPSGFFTTVRIGESCLVSLEGSIPPTAILEVIL
jgi:riboflavin kinase / FMN adenylyltransferase